jgi:hypothetical protein
MLLLENVSMLANFGNELHVTPECDVQNGHETVNGLSYSTDSHHRHEIIIHSILKIRIIRCGSSRSPFFAASDTAFAAPEEEEGFFYNLMNLYPPAILMTSQYCAATLMAAGPTHQSFDLQPVSIIHSPSHNQALLAESHILGKRTSAHLCMLFLLFTPRAL